MSDFFLACEEGNLEKVEEFIEQGHDANKRDNRYHGYGRTPLMYAAGEGRYDVVKCLIGHGADVKEKNFANRTLLHYASEGGNLKVVELLLSTNESVQIDQEDNGHRTPLMLAAEKRHGDVLLCLIDHGADVSKKDCNERTALHYASENGLLNMVELLLSKGAEIDVEDNNHNTPLMLAAKRGHNDISEHLINCGADVHKKDGRNRTALHFASESGHLEIVELLLSKGVEIDVEDENHCTPLILTTGRGHNDISLNFINRGADIHKKDVHNRTALHYVSQRGQLNIVKLLLNKGAVIDVEDENCCTPLLLATERGHNDVSLYLINHSANVCKKDGRNRTALHYAGERDQLNVAKLLLSKGAEIDIEDENRRTPLLLAAERGYNDVLLYLINHGADVNKRNYHEQTALHYASRRGDLEVVELLLSKGAEMDAEDEDLRTPMTVAVTYQKFNIMCHLITAGASVKRLADYNKRNLGREALLHAINTNHIQEACVLITNSIGIEGELDICPPRTALMWCAEKGCVSVVKHLILQGVNVNYQDHNGRNALYFAAESDDIRCGVLLVEAGANVRRALDIASTEFEDAVMQTLSHAINTKGIQEARKLITNSVCLSRTALMWCVEKGYVFLVKYLILQGVDVNYWDHNGRNALYYAAESDDIQCGVLLVEAGANVRRALDIASTEFEDAVMQTLSHAINTKGIQEAHKLITNSVGIEGELDGCPPRTALMWCVEKGYVFLVQHLILQGVDVNHLDHNGRNALYYAAESDDIQCGVLLVEAGANVRRALDIASTEFEDAVMQTLSFNTRKMVCVIGNTYSGKSTLIASLKNENAKLSKKIRHRLFGVKNISERTAGIEPVSLSSKRYGDMVFLDFAGQHEYHGPHEMFLESILSKSRSTMTIILVVKVTEKEPAISEQLNRWLYPVSKLASTTNPICVIVIGSHIDKVRSKAAAKEKLKRCYERVRQSLCDVPLEFQDACYLNCRQPYSSDIGRLCTYLNEVPIPEYKATKMPYSICWVISRMKTSLDSKAIQVEDFSDWIERNKANLPTNLPPVEEVCNDLSSTGHFIYLPNKEEPSNGWLVLDLPSILHEVYGTLFSPLKKIVNKFGLLNCQKLSDLFPTLDERMVRDVLISLEFCIEVDPSILVEEEITQLTQSTDEGHEHLFFPALVSSQPPKVFTSSQQGYHTLSWQLLVNKRTFISPRLLQTIILRLAAHHVFHYKRGPDTREHYCSVWSTGIFWQSTKDVDVAVQITDNTVVKVIGRSEVGPEALCLYISTITQDIFATIRELSPTLSATAYIIHPADPQVLLENPRSPSPQEMFPVEVILESARNNGSTCLSCKAENKTAERKQIRDLFSGFVPTEEVIRGLFIVSCKCCVCVCMHVWVGVCACCVGGCIHVCFVPGRIHM